MKQNWWKLLVVVVLAAAVVGVVVAKNTRTGRAQMPVAQKSVTAVPDAKPTAKAETDPSESGRPAMNEVSADHDKAQTQVADAAAEEPEGNPEVNSAAAKEAVQKPEAKAVKPEALKLGEMPKAEPAKKAAKVKRLPKLVDLGATKCIPCKMMAPVLEQLSKECKGKLDVVFIDVWEDREAGEKYGIQSIPTQIFYDANGKEFFRHVGFFPKNEILAKFKERGIDLQKE